MDFSVETYIAYTLVMCFTVQQHCHPWGTNAVLPYSLLTAGLRASILAPADTPYTVLYKPN